MTSIVNLDLLREAFQSLPERQKVEKNAENNSHKGDSYFLKKETSNKQIVSSNFVSLTDEKDYFPISLSGPTAVDYLPSTELLSKFQLEFMKKP